MPKRKTTADRQMDEALCTIADCFSIDLSTPEGQEKITAILANPRQEMDPRILELQRDTIRLVGRFFGLLDELTRR